MIRPVSSTRVSTETHAARSTSTKEKKLTSPPSRRSIAKRSPSTVLASRNLRRKRSPNDLKTARGRAPPWRPRESQWGNAEHELALSQNPLARLFSEIRRELRRLIGPSRKTDLFRRWPLSTVNTLPRALAEAFDADGPTVLE